MKHFVAGLGLVATMTACGGTTRGQAKVMGAEAIGCPKGDVTTTSWGAAQYTVRGCGYEAEVDCQDPRTVDRNQPGSEDNVRCTARKPRRIGST